MEHCGSQYLDLRSLNYVVLLVLCSSAHIILVTQYCNTVFR